MLCTCGGAITFPPLVKGGPGGVGRRTSASSVYSPFARNDVRKRHAIKGGEAAHAPSTSSFDRAEHASLVHSTLTGPPPRPPLHKGGKEDEASWNLRNELERSVKRDGLIPDEPSASLFDFLYRGHAEEPLELTAELRRALAAYGPAWCACVVAVVGHQPSGLVELED